MQVQVTNRARRTAGPLTWDDTVCLAWDTEAGVVLTSQALRGIAVGLWAATLGLILMRVLNSTGRNVLAASILVYRLTGSALSVSLMLMGLIMMALLLRGPLTLHGVIFDIHSMLYAAAAVIIGFQMIAFAVFARALACNMKLLPENRYINFLSQKPSLEIGIGLGIILCLTGLTGSLVAVNIWSAAGFGPLIPSSIMRIVIPSVTALTLGVQLILAAFFFAVIGLMRR